MCLQNLIKIPSMILQDIKETKGYGHTDGQRENSIPSHKHSVNVTTNSVQIYANVTENSVQKHGNMTAHSVQIHGTNSCGTCHV